MRGHSTIALAFTLFRPVAAPVAAKVTRRI